MKGQGDEEGAVLIDTLAVDQQPDETPAHVRTSPLLWAPTLSCLGSPVADLTLAFAALCGCLNRPSASRQAGSFLNVASVEGCRQMRPC